MTDLAPQVDASGSDLKTTAPDESDLPEHPRGTIAILLIYASLFAVGWVAFYLFIFLGRGATTH